MIAFMGISGAGKSTLLKAPSLKGSYHVVSASELIKKQILRQNTEAMSSEQLRLSTTAHMQAILIEAVKFERETAQYPLILDCHAVIDKGDRLDPIPIDVFKQIGVSRIIHLVVDPNDIWSRRSGDKSRTRPDISIGRLTKHQNASLSHAHAISVAVQAIYVETDGSDFIELLRALQTGNRATCRI